MVTAGAGSGKTRLLTHRIAHLINDKGVAPYHILAITFTNKAANEMRERVERMLDAHGSGVWVSTFHSMCVSMLRRFGDKIGYDKNFSIYGEVEKERLVKKLLKEISPEDEESLKTILWSISDAKNKDQGSEEYFKEIEYKREAELIRDVYAAYQEELKKSNALDFDDLLTKTYLMLASSQEAREYYQNKFRYIHVDEFQDTNAVQYRLVKILAGKHKNVMAVGDEDQSIYGWRGAEIGNLHSYIEDFGCKLYKLEQNYRSTKKILELANKVIAHNDNRMKKTLWTEKPDGEDIKLYTADSESEEAEYVAQKVLRLQRSENRRLSDFAVLLRLNALTRAFEEKFIQYGVPYKVTGGFKFYERKEIKDILAYLRLTVNHADNEAILRVINFPKRGIGDVAVKQLVNYSLVESKSLYDVIATIAQNTDLPKNMCKKIEPFAAVVKCLSEAAGTIPVDEFTKYLVRLLDLKSVYEEDTEENENRRLNIKELINSMQDYVKKNPQAGIDEYLQNVSLYSDTDDLDLEEGCIHIATVHSAKGLEFPCVFVAGLEDGIFPITRSIDSKSDLEEERRLMYVAITRAKERLFLSYAATRFLYGERKRTLPSRFLAEMGYRKNEELGIRSEEWWRNGRREAMSGAEGFVGRGLAPAVSDGYLSNAGAASFKNPQLPLRNNVVPVSEFRVGVRVSHRKFGVGIIASVSGTPDNCYAEIDFGQVGRLNLSLNYAPLTVAEEDKYKI